MHVLPFTIVGCVNDISGVNVVGLRRAEGITREDITEVRQVYRTLYREGRPLGASLESVNNQQWGPFAQRMIDFVNRVRAYEAPRSRGLAAPNS